MKKVLLIGGGGTLGSYTASELLKSGYAVDNIALENLMSLNRNLKYIRAKADDALLKELFGENRYDAIVDFIHYPNAEEYKKRALLLLENTDQLVFLSSYRIYADSKDGFITENSPKLIDTVKDKFFLENEDYAIPKSKNEDFLRSSGKKNFTIVRPMISFSHFRLDLVTVGANILLSRKNILLPEGAKNVIAGVCFAGNVGKLIARLIGKSEALATEFTLGTDENRPWSYVADCYEELLGVHFDWIDNEEYLKFGTPDNYPHHCMLYYDRLYNRRIDNSKVLSVTKTDKKEFVSIYDGIVHELGVIADNSELYKRFTDCEYTRMMNEKIDSYYAMKGKL